MVWGEESDGRGWEGAVGVLWGQEVLGDGGGDVHCEEVGEVEGREVRYRGLRGVVWEGDVRELGGWLTETNTLIGVEGDTDVQVVVRLALQ